MRQSLIVFDKDTDSVVFSRAADSWAAVDNKIKDVRRKRFADMDRYEVSREYAGGGSCSIDCALGR